MNLFEKQEPIKIEILLKDYTELVRKATMYDSITEHEKKKTITIVLDIVREVE